MHNILERIWYFISIAVLFVICYVPWFAFVVVSLRALSSFLNQDKQTRAHT